MSTSAARRLAWSLCGVSLALYVGGTILTILADAVTAFDLFLTFALIPFMVVGALIAARHPGNAIGWLFGIAGLVFAIAGFSYSYATYALATESGSLPGGVAAACLGSWLFLPALYGTPAFLFLLFPDGRPLTRRWRPAVGLAAVASVVVAIGAAFHPGPLEDSPVPGLANPLAIPLGDTAVAIVDVGRFSLGLASVGVAAASIVLRFRRARGEERVQLKWVAFAGALFALACLVSAVLFAVGFELLGQLVSLIAFGAIPIAAGIAILRHRLYDIDLVINRALVYGALTAALAAAYLGTVLLLGLALSPLTEQSDLAVAGSTLAVAALFRPARNRIQRLVDRRFYRRRYDAARTLERFGARLRDEVDLDALGHDLRGVVRETVAPAHVSLWLRSPGAVGDGARPHGASA